MDTQIKYYIVAAEALPEVFLKVAEAKRMLQTGEADTVGEATRLAGISRSAFYKYKDAVQPFNDMKTGRILTFYAMLKNNPGVLSNVLSIFAASGANILTINQSIPVNGCAAVTISAETSDMKVSLEEMVAEVSETYGAVKFEILAGE
ncbi:MAG: ACT domain-containing protein [Oscillospiraceae bacterium]|nr:ACT domain-containing protein [Oscillospiraceae bacterium]